MWVQDDKKRFLFALSIAVLFAANSAQKIIRAHLDPQVKAPTYTIEYDIPACRGTIYDSTGKKYPCAKSIPVWQYHLDPVDITNRQIWVKGEKSPRQPKAIVKTIADELKLDYQKVLAMASNFKNRYQYLAISSDREAHDHLVNSKMVSGVVVDDLQIRQFLHGRQLSHVLGSVNAEGVGNGGIEQKFNKQLTGVPGRVRGMKDVHGRELYERRMETIAPIPGADVYLTIDHNIQYEAETALASGVKEYGAAAGWCIVMDAKTGAVLAMASLPDFDPQTAGRASPEAKRNRCIDFNYEPGSVMKVITAASAVDAGMVKPETMYSTKRDDPKYYKLPGDGRHVWDPMMSVKNSIAKSSNIVVGKIGYDLGPEKLWTYMRRFGFGSQTGIELPGEQFGILRDWHKWDKATWSRAAIGQGLSVTGIQLASAYQAIANDGMRMQPYIVDKVVDASGEEVYRHPPTPVARAISAATAKKTRSMMLGVASPNGTARRAAIRGYSVAGKTGTAQKVVGGHYSDILFYASFCGIVPASDPRLVILVTLDFDQKRDSHQGGNSSGPIFRRIATAALRYLRIEPDRPEEITGFDDDDEFDQIMEERARGISNASHP